MSFPFDLHSVHPETDFTGMLSFIYLLAFGAYHFLLFVVVRGNEFKSEVIYHDRDLCSRVFADNVFPI